jgi:hypothetical protein
VAYQHATALYSKAVTDMRASMAISPWDAFRDLKKLAEDSRLQSALARLELEKHKNRHGADFSIF